MFGNLSDPTKNYRYGIRNSKFEGHDVALEQMRSGHNYRNKLVELERTRRERMEALLRRYSPELVDLDKSIAAKDAEVEAARDAVQRDKVIRRNKKADPALSKVVKGLLAELKPMRARQKKLRSEIYADFNIPKEPKAAVAKLKAALAEWSSKFCGKERDRRAKVEELQAAAKASGEEAPPIPPALRPPTQAEIEQQIRDAISAVPLRWKPTQLWFDQYMIELDDRVDRLLARRNCGCYHGTYLAIEQAAGSFRRGAPPKFLSWRGDGRVAIQIPGGLLFADALAKPNSVLYLVPRERTHHPKTSPAKEKEQRKCYWCYFRVASDEKHKPIWLVMQVILHRMPPDGAVIKWAYVHRKLVGEKPQWRLTLCLAMKAGFPPPENLATTGTAAVDLGWRVKPDRSIRVGYYHGSDGQSDEITVDGKVLNGHNRVDVIQSHRKRMFNAVHAELVKFVKEADVPDLLREQLTAVEQWKSSRRMSRLVRFWKDHRSDLKEISRRAASPEAVEWMQNELKHTKRWTAPEGPLTMFDVLEFWAWREDHLFPYEANLRQQVNASRLDYFRVWCARMRERYATVVLEGDPTGGRDGQPKWMDLQKFGMKAPPEGEEEQLQIQRRIARLAAPGELRQTILQSGMNPVAIEPAYTSRVCPDCGHTNEGTTEMTFICGGCNVEHDVDHVAARNLLAAALGLAPSS